VFVQPDHALKSAEGFKEELLKLDQEVGAVVVDFDPNINYIKMMKAVLHLRDPVCLFVVGSSHVLVRYKDINIIGGFLC
jgi:hypothetical protein